MCIATRKSPLAAIGHHSQVTTQKLTIAGHHSQVTTRWSPVRGHHSQVTSQWSQIVVFISAITPTRYITLFEEFMWITFRPMLVVTAFIVELSYNCFSERFGVEYRPQSTTYRLLPDCFYYRPSLSFVFCYSHEPSHSDGSSSLRYPPFSVFFPNSERPKSHIFIGKAKNFFLL